MCWPPKMKPHFKALKSKWTSNATIVCKKHYLIWVNRQFYRFLGKLAGPEDFDLGTKPYITDPYDTSKTITLAHDHAHTIKSSRNWINNSRDCNATTETGNCLTYKGKPITWDIIYRLYDEDKMNIIPRFVDLSDKVVNVTLWCKYTYF